jgi:ElaB/YqjD/DUF883 family membrane-anchored ribosome-binding protein
MTDTATLSPPSMVSQQDALKFVSELDPHSRADILTEAARLAKAHRKQSTTVFQRTADRVRKVAYDVRNTVCRFVDWLINRTGAFFEKHPWVHAFAEFTFGFVIGVVMTLVAYVFIMYAVAGALILLGV